MTSLIEHRGLVQRLEGGKAEIVMETAGCASCGQGGSCGVGKMAAGRPATRLTIPVSDELKQQLQAGDVVSVALPAQQLSWTALLGYLFPALAMLIGAALGNASTQGSDGATAIGAMFGFISALILTRIAIALHPAWMPMPQLIPISRQATPFLKESYHD